MSDINNDPGSDDFDWQEFLEANFEANGSTPVEEAPGEPPPTEEPEVEGAVEDEAPSAEGEEPVPPPAPTPGEFIDLAGVQIPAEHAERVANFWTWMNEHPEDAVNFMSVLLGEADVVPKGARPEPTPVSAPAAPEPAAPLDTSGPDWEFIPDALKSRLVEMDTQNRTLAERQAVLDQAVAWQQQQAVAQQNEQLELAVAKGAEAFRSRYEVTDLELEQLKMQAAQLGVAPVLAQQLGDPAEAVNQALEIAYMRVPEYRQRSLAQITTDAQEKADADARRQEKLGSLAGSGAATSREVTPPSTPEARRQAMVQEIAAAVYPNGSRG